MKAPWTIKKEKYAPLKGKNLACWCKPGAPCHADILLECVNGRPPDLMEFLAERYGYEFTNGRPHKIERPALEKGSGGG